MAKLPPPFRAEHISSLLRPRGFASTAPGNPLTLEDQEKKLHLVVEVAQKVWG